MWNGCKETNVQKMQIEVRKKGENKGKKAQMLEWDKTKRMSVTDVHT